MTPARPRYARIEQLADGLLREAGITDAPVPIDDIVRGQGITICLMDLKEFRAWSSAMESAPLSASIASMRLPGGASLSHMNWPMPCSTRARKFITIRISASTFDPVRHRLVSTSWRWRPISSRRRFLCLGDFLEADPLVAGVDFEDAESAIKRLAARYKVSPHAMSIRIGNLSARSAR